MSQAELEQRVMMLENELALVKAELQRLNGPNDWRSALGMFTGDETMKDVFEAGRKIREADRRRTKPRATRRKAKA